jgi:hypothetical protein
MLYKNKLYICKVKFNFLNDVQNKAFFTVRVFAV